MSLENHETVKHSHLEYVRGPVHANGVESFWSMLKRAHMTFHKISTDHLHRYAPSLPAVTTCGAKTRDQLALVADQMIGKRLRYKDLVR